MYIVLLAIHVQNIYLYHCTGQCSKPDNDTDNAGSYMGHWFNTHTGEDLATSFVTCDNNQLRDSIPTFTEDIAVYHISQT